MQLTQPPSRRRAALLLGSVVACGGVAQSPSVAPEPAAPVTVAVSPTAPAAPEPAGPPDVAPPTALVRCEAQPDPARVEAAAQHVRAAARTHDVDPALVAAVIWVESKFNPRARGPGGSAGLMQLMPRTSRSLAAALHRAHRPWDAGFNVDAGTYYLARLLRRFGGDETLALAAYNRGPGAVAKWTAAGSDLPEGARAYAARVLAARPCFATL